MKTNEIMVSQLSALVEGVPHFIANLSNASALVYDAMEDVNWAGFYLLEVGTLVLGPFQGRHACIEIPVGRGVCGTCAEKGETVVVPDVREFPGHIACDSASRSEIVVPIRRDGRVVAVLDVDSPLPDRFGEEDRAILERFVKVLEEKVFI